MKEKRAFDISSAGLHIIAMACMLCDHIWATAAGSMDVLTCIGRLAFPIFAFLIVEGYFHTRSLRRYVLRLLGWALLAELPFNLMMSGGLLYPIHQNAIWTLLIGLLLVHLNERTRNKKLFARILVGIGTVLLGAVMGIVTFADYYAAGVLMVLAFYFFRGRKWWCFLGQLAAMWYLNVVVLSGLYYEVELFGHSFELVRQGFALLALVPIWLYKGRKGLHSRAFSFICYAFYPAHMLLLYLIMLI